MNNDNYPPGSDLSYAPWNDDNTRCTECGSYNLELHDTGDYKGITWKSYKCLECSTITNNEPDYE